MPTYRIVLDAAPSTPRAIVFLDLEEDDAALEAGAQALYPSETALVWEADRLVGRIEGPGKTQVAPTARPLLQKLHGLICTRLRFCSRAG
jgi:hypothetical protein